MPTNYPSAWGKISLGELISTIRNGTTSQQMDYATPFPVTRIETISEGLINFSRVKYLARPEPAYLLKKNDILYSHINSIKHMGKVALYDGMSPLYHGMNLMLLRPNEGKVYPKFLFVYLSSEFGRAHARKECKSAINQASLGQGDIKNLKIHLPPLPEQCRIAEILDTIDEAIQKTEALISKLKAMKQGLLHDLLTRGLDKNGKLRDPKAYPEQFKNSLLGMIPRHWDVRPLGVTATLQRGFDLPIQDRRVGDVPIFGSNGIDGHHNESRVSGPGVITGRSGSIGFVYYTDTNFWPLNTTLYVKEFHGNRPKFIRLLLESLRLDRFTAATGVPSLNRNFVHPIEVIVPEPAEQDRIVDVVEAHDASVRTEEQYRDKLKLQKKGLMHDLLTGKVRVEV